jgi:hypothetical protein
MTLNDWRVEQRCRHSAGGSGSPGVIALSAENTIDRRLQDPRNPISDPRRPSMMTDGSVMQDGHESHVWHGQGLSSHEPSAESASVRSRPGIFIFSHRGHLLHMSRRALELIGLLDQAEIEPNNDVCFAPVRELLARIQETLDHRNEANIRDPFELKRWIFEAGRKILVRGFGVGDRNSHNDSRIVIVLEEVGLSAGTQGLGGVGPGLPF